MSASALGRAAGRVARDEGRGQLRDLVPDPLRHSLLLLHQPVAGLGDLRLAGGLRRDAERAVAAGLKLLEGMTAERVLEHLVAGEGMQHALHVGADAHGRLFQARRALAELLEAALDRGLLRPRLLEVLAQTRLRLRI